MQNQRHNKSFKISSYYRNLVTVTVVAVYLLILAGGIVRSTGSGMGCPDWPKCFGQWVPPTSAEELPEDYQDFYAEYRHQKNIKFAKYLDVFGYSEIGKAILEDESIKEEAAFNASKTWTEYVNRLLGAVVGFLIILCVVGAVYYIKKSKTIFILAFSSLVLVLIQGWIGSVVVSTNLLSWLITVHMVLALVILAVLTALYFVVHRKEDQKEMQFIEHNKLTYVLVVAMIMILVQIVLGTQVRESLDIVASRLGDALRGSWIEGLGIEFYIHRSFSIAIAIIHIYLLFKFYKLKDELKKIYTNVKVLMSLIVLEILSGTIMAYFAIPFWAQPIHLVLGSMIFGAQFYIFLQVVYTTQKTNKKEYAIS
ncbi:cytochrome oxidase assembly protein [Marivirga tractuosa]|uniref:Cytochrome oxidase assembly n=1 Tax=Marivirga tractuosa (strain ATCC 23168 / DSM 4126 / NBRC 15989 / NCIMB 1408 / VKM B-1430 / H-43) TaxID=643867 RepID=E4TQG8_MARTH|nr:COX15/CtaA family protein [Marivirga tractuosa]ADR23661.1 cytochrome oxidase assembly [Marivirga tractuosa DSM 4126]BDD15658.1 cytochrome oxidase assembly protein [Marivirga tractuosa]